MSTGSSRTGREASCLTGDNALTHHSVNQQLFMMICSTSIGFSNLDTASCGQTVFNSQRFTTDPSDPDATGLEPRVMVALTNILSGRGPAFAGHVFAIIVLLSVSHVIWSLRQGYRHYLRMPHGLSVAVASQIIAFLGTAAILQGIAYLAW